MITDDSPTRGYFSPMNPREEVYTFSNTISAPAVQERFMIENVVTGPSGAPHSAPAGTTTPPHPYSSVRRFQ